MYMNVPKQYLTLSLFPIYVRTLQEGGASNEVIDDVDGNCNGDGVLSDWIIDELEKLCYYTELTCENILDSSGSHDYACEAQHQSTEDNGVDFLRELPEEAITEYTGLSF